MSDEQIKNVEADRERVEQLIAGNRQLIEHVRDDRQREDAVARQAKQSLRRAQVRIRRAALGH
jgi:hypothetical protein